jgi:hypothetical protein
VETRPVGLAGVVGEVREEGCEGDRKMAIFRTHSPRLHIRERRRGAKTIPGIFQLSSYICMIVNIQ